MCLKPFVPSTHVAFNQGKSNIKGNEVELIPSSMPFPSNATKPSSIENDISDIRSTIKNLLNTNEEALTLKQDVSNIRKEISDMKRRLAFINGKDNVQKCYKM